MKEAARAPRETGRVAVTLDPSAPLENESLERIGASSSAPAWQRDTLSVSARVRAILDGLRPLVVHVLAFWDHAVRAVRIAGRRLEVDPSGSYRLR